MKREMRSVGELLLLAGCLFAVNVMAETVPALPEAGGLNIFPSWKTVRDDASAQAQIISASEKVSCPEPGLMLLPVHFLKEKPIERANWDIKLPCQLNLMRGIQFDFYCGDVTLFSGFSLYFKSGNGWYHATFSPTHSKRWQHITINKGDAIVEPPVPENGWAHISAVRLSAWHARNGNTVCAIGNIAPVEGNKRILVLRAESRVGRPGSDGNSLLTFADTVATTFDAMGFNPVQMADTNVPDEVLDHAKLVVLPYNPIFPPETAAQLKKFVDRGGKLLVCYSLTPEVEKLIGVKSIGYATSNNGTCKPLIGFRKEGKGLRAQPDFAEQNSWCCNVVKPATEEGKVIARWEDRDSLTKYPALIRTPTGIFMSHVWLGGVSGKPLQLMRAIAGDLVPDLWEKSARESLNRIAKFSQYKSTDDLKKDLPKKPSADLSRKWNDTLQFQGKAKDLFREKQWIKSMEYSEKAAEAAIQTWMLMQPSAKGEHRAFWCHSAWGMGGKNNWDSSIRTLKENGFTDLMVNLCWGGSAYYNSKVLPVHESVARRGDALVECLAACKKYGIKCHVWKVCWNMGGHTSKAFSNEMIQEKRVQYKLNGKMQERWLCPSHPLNQQLEIDTMIELAEKGVDGVHFDYIRYPGNDTCYCEGCRDRFQKKIGKVVKNWPGDLQKDPGLKKEWTAFRVESITKPVRTVANRLHKDFPKVEISAAVFRDPLTNPESVGQDWKTWCRKGWLDFACPMDYVDSPVMFYSLVTFQRDVVGKDFRLYPGIGLSCWKRDEPLAVRTAEQIQMARKAGMKGFTIFNLDGKAEQVLPYLGMGATKGN